MKCVPLKDVASVLSSGGWNGTYCSGTDIPRFPVDTLGGSVYVPLNCWYKLFVDAIRARGWPGEYATCIGLAGLELYTLVGLQEGWPLGKAHEPGESWAILGDTW